jgi:transcriptional regulator with XRE-family HTH domain
MIRFHRKKAGLTQTELSELAGLGKTVVFDIEHGKDTIKWSTLVRILQVLNISVAFDSPLMATFKESGDADR